MRKSKPVPCLIPALLGAVLTLSACQQGAHDAATTGPEYDAIVRNGTVFDGTGRPGFKADVAIAGGRIARVGNLAGATAPVDIDANGLFVAPGFINLHSHPGEGGLQTAVNMLTQGVVTELVNPDGGGPTDISTQLQQYGEPGLALNVGAYIGFGSVWREVVGTVDRRAKPDEIQRMQQIIVKNLAAGAWGVSAGLDYKPSYYATTDEVVEVVKSSAPWRTNFPNHDRLTPETNFSSRVGIAETLTIGERAGLVPVVTHMKVQGIEQGSASAVLEMITKAGEQGHYAAADVYPYLAGFTGLASLLVPGWAQDGGREAMLARFKDSAQRARITKEIERAMKLRFGGPQGVYVVTIGRELTDVMQEMKVPAGEAVIRLLEQQEMGAILRFGAEEDLVKLLKYPLAAIACDCGSVAKDTLFNRHPRVYGTFPRVLGHYVRDGKLMSWQEAIRKMSGLPATMIGLTDRGFIAAGMMADLAVFDPATIADRATFEQPAELSVGMQHVFVNGKLALRDGKPTGVHAGAVLLRTASMPSRPMTPEVARRLVGRAKLAPVGDARTTSAGESGYELVFDLAQAPDEGQAQGKLELLDGESRPLLQVRDLGLLQTTTDWDSVTGIAQDAAGKLQGVTVIVDGGDPEAAQGRTTVTVQADGLPLLRGQIDSASVRSAAD